MLTTVLQFDFSFFISLHFIINTRARGLSVAMATFVKITDDSLCPIFEIAANEMILAGDEPALQFAMVPYGSLLQFWMFPECRKSSTPLPQGSK